MILVLAEAAKNIRNAAVKTNRHKKHPDFILRVFSFYYIIRNQRQHHHRCHHIHLRIHHFHLS